MNVLIVEDEPLYANHLEILVEELGYSVIGCADEANAALALAKATSPDLVLMDVNIVGAYDGVETAELLRREHACPVIFITSREDEQTFLRAGRLGPVNFLLKPFNDLQLKRAVQLALVDTPQPTATDDTLATEEENLYVRTGHKLQKIPVGEITSIAADGRYCEVHTVDHRYLIRMSLRELSEKLPQERFLKTHRGHLVQEAFVESVDLRDSEVVLTGGRRVPLAKREREAFLRRIDG